MDFQVVVSEWIGGLAELLPFGYAFGAGMVSAVNPCGFFMLPVYLTLYLGAEQQEFTQHSLLRRMVKAVGIALVVTAGFGVLFGVVGTIISVGGYFLMGAIPWFALVMGVVLIALGIWILLGHTFSFGMANNIAAKVGDPRNISIVGFFLFGVAFAITSLGCTLPIFLAVVGSSLANGDIATSVNQFLSYVFGVGFVFTFLLVGIALVKKGLVLGVMRRVVPYVHKISAILLLLAGSYILYYWLSSGLLFAAE